MARFDRRPLASALFTFTLALGTVPLLGMAQEAEAPLPAVAVAAVKAEEFGQSMDFIGRVEALQQVELRARVEGVLEVLDFAEGSSVKAGQPLFRIESAPYEAALAGARAALAGGHAALAGAQAALTQAQQEVDRQATLVERGAAPQAVLDTAVARRDEAQAQVEAANAQIAQAEAQIQAAELNLSYTQIASPIDGRIGRANITAGNLVGPQSGVLATVVQVDPVRAVFSITERDYVTLIKVHRGQPSAEISGEFAPRLRLPDGGGYGHAGAISFIDNRVDPHTATIAVRAEFANPDLMLVPGQFVMVTVAASDPRHLPMVPASAVMQDRDGTFVFVLDHDNRAQVRRVETSSRTADGVAVASGLAEGEVIIVSGLQRVHPGQAVSPQQLPGE